MPDAHEQRVLDDVARFGWSLILVPDDKKGPGFVYSVGMMATLEHPEIIMFGLNLNLMASVINGIGDDIRAGRDFSQLGLFEGLLDNYACKMIDVETRRHSEFLGYAMWHRRHLRQVGTLRVLQCLWPDKSGLFPDEWGCHPSATSRQPKLSS